MSDKKDSPGTYYSVPERDMRYTQSSFSTCAEIMSAVYTRAKGIFQRRHGPEFENFQFLFDSVTGVFMLTAVVDGEEVEEFVELEEFGYLHHKTKVFQQVTVEETQTSPISESAEGVEGFYDFMLEAIKSLSDD